MNMLALLFATPLAAAILSIIARKQRMITLVAVVATALEVVLALLISAKTASGSVVALTGSFAAPALSCIVLVTIAVTGFFCALYSSGYFAVEVAKGIVGFRRVRQYFALVHLFLLAMFVATLTTAPMIMWIAIELTTLVTAFLVSFYNKPSAIEAAWKYLIINSVGLLLGFLGTLLFFTCLSDAGTALVTWDTLRAAASHLNPSIAKISFVLVLIGYGTKVGFVPMHTWKPDVYSKVPTPVAMLFSGPLVNVALLALLQFKIITDAAIGSAFTGRMLIVFGLASVLLAACVIFTQWNFKRLFAYSGIEHAGIMALGFGFGGIGTFAAILHMLYHTLAKSVLFTATGNVFLKYSSTKIERVRGMLTTLPATTIVFIAGFLATVGLPPFGIFFTEFYIVAAGIGAHPIATAGLILSLAVVFIGFLKQAMRMTFGAPPKGVSAGEGSYATLLPPMVLLGILFIASVYLPFGVKAFIETAAASL